jgi:hypothetical protein
MKNTLVLLLAVVGLIWLGPLAAPVDAQAQQKPVVKIPEPGVPQIMTLEGAYVRAAYNNEGYAILGYRLANQSVGQESMLLEFGTTLRAGVPDYTLTRDLVSIETPDGKTIPLLSLSDYRKGDMRSLERQATVTKDSINYFPPTASRACRIGFFAELGSPARAYDQVDLTPQHACLGRLFFQVPGGIQYGQHWLNVKFKNSLVRVPFRILTKEEEKLLSKNLKDIQKQVKDAFTKK